MSINILCPKPSTLHVKRLTAACCSHVVSRRAWDFHVDSHVICIPCFIIRFVNVYADVFYFLGTILPKDDSALEYYSCLFHCQMFRGVTEFNINLVYCAKVDP